MQSFIFGSLRSGEESCGCVVAELSALQLLRLHSLLALVAVDNVVAQVVERFLHVAAALWLHSAVFHLHLARLVDVRHAEPLGWHLSTMTLESLHSIFSVYHDGQRWELISPSSG